MIRPLSTQSPSDMLYIMSFFLHSCLRSDNAPSRYCTHTPYLPPSLPFLFQSSPFFCLLHQLCPLATACFPALFPWFPILTTANSANVLIRHLEDALQDEHGMPYRMNIGYPTKCFAKESVHDPVRRSSSAFTPHTSPLPFAILAPPPFCKTALPTCDCMVC